MLPNIDQSVYDRFKSTGYRIKKYKVQPVESIDDVVHLGYLDVCRTMKGIDTGQSRSFKQSVITFISDLLISQPNSQAEFDLLHHQCCQQCLNCIGSAHVHYGQAQKLLNMSLKYLYNEFACYTGRMNRFDFPDNNIEYLFHLPIDSQIRTCLVNKYDFINPTSLPWSRWTYDHYIAFQSELRNRIKDHYKPLEIDYMIWNNQNTSIGNALRD